MKDEKLDAGLQKVVFVIVFYPQVKKLFKSILTLRFEIIFIPEMVLFPLVLVFMH